MADVPASVEVTESDGLVVLSPNGELGMHESPALRQSLQTAIGKKPRRVVVNLAGVPYMSTAGVATLVESLRTSREAGVELVLCGMQQRVKAVFDIARLTTVFRVVSTLEDAKK